MPAAPQHDLDAVRLRDWLAGVVDPSIASVTVDRLAGGHSSGAWRLTCAGSGSVRELVLKAPSLPSVVYQRDAVREARIMDGAQLAGAPVPEVVATDETGEVVGRPCFTMAYIDGRSVGDQPPGAYHSDEVLRAAGPDVQREIWESFHDALARLHAVDAASVPAAAHGDGRAADTLAYWRASLLDAAPAGAVPRHLAALDWLAARVPPGADESPTLCMGDARLVNGIIVGDRVETLVDFEVAHAGNPAADIGYSLFTDAMARRSVPDPLPLPTADETWRRWSRATGRPAVDREYWTAFAATIIVITASRAMVQWGVCPADAVEASNPLVDLWESAVQAARSV